MVAEEVADRQKLRRLGGAEDRRVAARVGKCLVGPARAQLAQAPSALGLSGEPDLPQEGQIALAAPALVGPGLPGITGWTVHLVFAGPRQG